MSVSFLFYWWLQPLSSLFYLFIVLLFDLFLFSAGDRWPDCQSWTTNFLLFTVLAHTDTHHPWKPDSVKWSMNFGLSVCVCMAAHVNGCLLVFMAAHIIHCECNLRRIDQLCIRMYGCVWLKSGSDTPEKPLIAVTCDILQSVLFNFEEFKLHHTPQNKLFPIHSQGLAYCSYS